MNTIIENDTTVAVESANNIETSTPSAPKAKVGRPRKNLTREVIFVQNADGSIIRRGKGKPAYNSRAMVYSVAWNYKGTSLPEESMFLRMAEVKDTRKPKETPTTNPVIPNSTETLPTLVG